MPNDLCKRLGVLCVVVWLFTTVTSVEAQTVTVTGSVSETVAIGLGPNPPNRDVRMDVVSSGRTLQMALAGNGAGSSVIRVPLLVRSNSGFKISGKFESTTAEITQLSVMDVRATGPLVSPDAIYNLQIRPEFDVASPFVLLSGPRVSLGGNLNSPNNALQIILLIHVKSESVTGWLAHLTFFND